MPTLTVNLSDVIHAGALELVPRPYATLDWLVERALLDKVSEVRTEQAAPPRLRASAYRIAGAIEGRETPLVTSPRTARSPAAS